MASGSIGAFVILRRMALVGDALSHVALPGIALALLYHFDPFWGVVASLIGASLVVWWLEAVTSLPTESLVGVLFTASLAIGTLLVPSEDLAEALFGAFPRLSSPALGALVAVAGATTCVSFLFARRFLLLSLSPELAHVCGVSRLTDFVLLLNFALVVALGIKLVGTLLMGALTIIPASIAKNAFRSVVTYVAAATVLGVLVAVGGVLVAERLELLPGPTIVLLGIAVFIASLGRTP
jgi:zinc transport system permease protein